MNNSRETGATRNELIATTIRILNTLANIKRTSIVVDTENLDASIMRYTKTLSLLQTFQQTNRVDVAYPTKLTSIRVILLAGF